MKLLSIINVYLKSKSFYIMKVNHEIVINYYYKFKNLLQISTDIINITNELVCLSFPNLENRTTTKCDSNVFFSSKSPLYLSGKNVLTTDMLRLIGVFLINIIGSFFIRTR